MHQRPAKEFRGWFLLVSFFLSLFFFFFLLSMEGWFLLRLKPAGSRLFEQHVHIRPPLSILLYFESFSVKPDAANYELTRRVRYCLTKGHASRRRWIFFFFFLRIWFIERESSLLETIHESLETEGCCLSILSYSFDLLTNILGHLWTYLN